VRLVYGTNAGTYFPQAQRRGGFLFLSSLLGSHTCSPPPPPEHRLLAIQHGPLDRLLQPPAQELQGCPQVVRPRGGEIFVYADFCAIFALVVLGASWRAGQNHIAINTNKPNKISAITRGRRREEGEEGEERRAKSGLELVDLDITISRYLDREYFHVFARCSLVALSLLRGRAISTSPCEQAAG